MAEKVIASKICPEKLQTFWQDKEYRNLPSVIICWCIQISKSKLAHIFNKVVWLSSIATANSRTKLFHVEHGINQNHTKKTKAPCSRYFLQWGLA